MKKYLRKQFNVNGVAFNIFSDITDEISEYFKESVIDDHSLITSEYNIYFYEDPALYLEKIRGFRKDKAVSYDTFNNQVHYKYGNTFMIDNEEYLCEVIDDNNFVVYSGNKEKSCKNLIRIMREILVRDMEDKGYFFMHGNGIRIMDHGILILGGSGSGKTTFTSKINSEVLPQEFISNDRIFITEDEMRYFPLPIVYAMGTVKTNPNLDKFFRENNVLELRRGGKYEEASFGKKCDVPLSAIPKIFPWIKNRPTSQIDLVVFPRITDKKEQIKVLNLEEASERLDLCNFTPNDTESNRKPWIKFRKITDKALDENKKILNRSLSSRVMIIDFPYQYETSGKEIVKSLKRFL